MPDDMAKKVREALSRKSITPEEELQTAIDEMARDIALIEPDPQDWGWWVSYLLERMEGETRRRRKQDEYKGTIKAFSENLYKYNQLKLTN
jgi:methionine synthase II (cobalamin-independent)